MAEVIRVLHVEDSPADAELLHHHMRRDGLPHEIRRVQSEREFRRELAEFRPHLILSDFTLPGFGGMAALRIMREAAPEMPFIFVSGTIREDFAVDALKAGASDYVLKNNLVRLVPAIRRALADAALRHAHREAEAERARLEQVLRDSEAGLKRAQAMARLAHVVTGPDGRFESWSESLPDLLQVEPGQVPADIRAWMHALHPEDRDPFRMTAVEAARTRVRADIEYRAPAADGGWITIRHVMEPVDETRGDDSIRIGASRWFNTLQDVTEQRRAEEKIRRMNRVYAVLSGINTLIVRAADRTELFREACRVAVEEGGFVLAWIGLVDEGGRSLRLAASHDTSHGYVDLLPLGLDAGAPGGLGFAGRAIAERRALVANDISQGGLSILKDEALARGFRSMVALPLIVRGDSIGVLSLYSDMVQFFDSEEMKLLLELSGDIAFALDHLDQAERLEYLAYYDPLTGLANRRLFEERLAQIVGAARRENERLAVLMMDVVRFKTINDTFGRHAGDVLLQDLTARAADELGGKDWMAHLGGDDFVLVMPDIGVGDEVGWQLEERMRAILGAPFKVADTDLRISVKMGISIFPDDGSDADTLLKNAEVALKRSKTVPEPYLFFSQEMSERVAERLMLENRLRLAAERNEFVLHYQPKVDLKSGALSGVEALIRWQSPEMGLVPPVQFIPLLEETGLILEVGIWALKQAVADYRDMAARGLMPPRIAVNVSPMQLRRADFAETVRKVVGEGAQASGIDIEVTESLVMEDVAGNVSKLQSLRALGINISIDDFGTGYSSLAYLARLPVQILKIDRSFVSTMLQETATMTLVSTMISLAHSLSLKVVAEGVESQVQADVLKRLRCDQMQGYLFSKPLPLPQLIELLGQHRVIA